mgnify:CR=1 FL=1
MSRTFTKAGTKITENFEKWELISTHTARRFFASNMYLMGIPTITIMAITGHKAEKAFMKYIKLSKSEQAKIMQLHWKKNKATEIKAI